MTDPFATPFPAPAVETPAPAPPRRRPGRGLLLAGVGLAVLGLAACVAQYQSGNQMAPWYMPSLATLGAVLVAASLWQARGVWRVLALVFVGLLAGAEWAFLLVAGLPPYTGPVAAGRPFPTFATVRADGTPFTQRDLAGDQKTVMVFFRGRW